MVQVLIPFLRAIGTSRLVDWIGLEEESDIPGPWGIGGVDYWPSRIAGLSPVVWWNFLLV